MFGLISLITPFLSLLAGGLPKLLDMWQDSKDKAHELSLAQMQMTQQLQMQQAGFQAQKDLEEVRLDEIKVQSASDEKVALIGAQQAEMQAIYAHDISLNEGTSQWMKNLRASVRPVITYGFFGLLCALDAVLAYKGFEAGVSFKEMADQLWDDETQALFASIIAFHFGGRAFGK